MKQPNEMNKIERRKNETRKRKIKGQSEEMYFVVLFQRFAVSFRLFAVSLFRFVRKTQRLHLLLYLSYYVMLCYTFINISSPEVSI